MIQTDVPTIFKAGTARRDPVSSLAQRVKHWELVQLAAEGALTRVYRARPEGADDGRPAAYAVKILREKWENDPRAIHLLRQETLVGRTVSHPHLISVLAAGLGSPPYFVVTPWLAGKTLAARLADVQPVDPPAALWIARQTAAAMAALHRDGWMHGDIKPSNIFVSPEGHVTLLDLGFAHRTDVPEPATERCVTGTYNYIAPEMVARGMPIDVRSDIYSLGVVLFEMLAGRLPFPGGSAAELARQHREVRVPDLCQLAPHLPREACRLVREILAKEPLRRPQTPAELVDRLLRLEIVTFSMWGSHPSTSSA